MFVLPLAYLLLNTLNFLKILKVVGLTAIVISDYCDFWTFEENPREKLDQKRSWYCSLFLNTGDVSSLSLFLRLILVHS